MANKSFFEFTILVKGKPIREYYHEDNIFIEGRKGSEFEIEFKNKAPFRILAIPSVDGINTIDGKEATYTSKGYIVPANSSVRIPGWILDNNNVAKFKFDDESKAYANFASSSKSSSNTGVIGFIVFNEKFHYNNIIYNGYPTYIPNLNIVNSCTVSNIQPTNTYNLSNMTAAQNVSDMISSGVMRNSVMNSATSTSTVEESQFSLGTTFGEQAGFKTESVAFERNTNLAEMVIYYDTKKNLISRGVIKESPKQTKDLPKAFIGGCTPPPGWRG